MTPKEALQLAQEVVDWDDGKKPRSASNWIHADTIALAREVLRLQTWQTPVPEAAGYDIAKAQDAAWAFRESLVPRADSFACDGKFPLWHGWAIFDAFMAGADFARSPLAGPPKPVEPPVYVFNEHGRMVGFAFR